MRLVWVVLPALALGLILIALSEQGLVHGEDPATAPPALIAEPDTPLVHALGTADREAWEWEVIRLVNQERTNRGIPPLKRNDALDMAAYGHSQDVGGDNYLDHDSYDYNGSSWSQVQAWADRVRSFYLGGTYIAENIAFGHTSPASVMSAWMASEYHRRNITSTNHTEIGIGYYYDATDSDNVYIPVNDPGKQYGNGPYYHYWVQDFGNRSGVYPVIINNEAYSTTNPTVELYIYGPSDATQMRFRNEGENWPDDWETYNSVRQNWSLATGSAITRTVYAQVRSGSQTFEASDYIYYSGTDPVLSVSPSSVTFLTKQGSGTCTPGTNVIHIPNAGGGTLDWDATRDGSWFDIVTGSNDITITCIGSIVDDFGLGTQTGDITVTAESAQNSPQAVSVRLVVAEGTYNTYLPSVIRNHTNP